MEPSPSLPSNQTQFAMEEKEIVTKFSQDKVHLAMYGQQHMRSIPNRKFKRTFCFLLS